MDGNLQIQKRLVAKVERIEKKRHQGQQSLAKELALHFLTHAAGKDWQPIDSAALIESGIRRGVAPSRNLIQNFSIIGISTGTESACGVVSRFAFDSVFRKKDDSAERHDISIDAPFACCLVFSGYPLAVASFDLFADGAMECCQLQGTASAKFNCNKDVYETALRQFDWAKILIDWSVEWARKERLEFRILPGYYNRWTKVLYEDGTPHLAFSNALHRYDVTALRLGFRLYSRAEQEIDVTDKYLGNIKSWQRGETLATPPYPPNLFWSKRTAHRT